MGRRERSGGGAIDVGSIGGAMAMGDGDYERMLRPKKKMTSDTWYERVLSAEFARWVRRRV